MRKIVASLAVLLLVGSLVIAAGESKYQNASASVARIVFGPARGATVVKSINAQTDLEGGLLKIRARKAASLNPSNLSATNTTAATTLNVVNTGNAFTTNDVVCIVYADGNIDYRTVTGNTLTTITVAATSQAGLLTTKIYEVEQKFSLDVGAVGTAVGTNDIYTANGDALYISPSDSPVVVEVTGTTNPVINASVIK